MLPLYPGLVLYTTAGRLMRPVRSLVTGSVDYIGTLEQVWVGGGWVRQSAGREPDTFLPESQGAAWVQRAKAILRLRVVVQNR